VSEADTAPVVPILTEEEIMPGFDDEVPVAVALSGGGPWPSIAWEKTVIEEANHPGLPRLLDQFSENNTDYMVLEVPVGAVLWDAWDDPDADSKMKYTWLQQIAAILQALHSAGALYEGIRPDVIVVGDGNIPRLTDLTDLLPLPLPKGTPIKATLYTAPELIL
jgi:serine/threonine protein kinase